MTSGLVESRIVRVVLTARSGVLATDSDSPEPTDPAALADLCGHVAHALKELHPSRGIASYIVPPKFVPPTLSLVR